MLDPSSIDFNDLALEIFRFQYQNIEVYHKYIDHLGIDPEKIERIIDIPFLPIRFFKNHKINLKSSFEISFASSGTTGAQTSHHWVADLELYHLSIITAFTKAYGNPKDYCILALLPSYLERNNSSLVYMVQHLMGLSNNPLNAFYLNDFKMLNEVLQTLNSQNQQSLLFGVSFALLDFTEKYQNNFDRLSIIETGGMKGRRKEIIRAELHNQLQLGFGTKNIHSEYGMTELLSMSYALESGHFEPSPSQKILIRDINDPRSYVSIGNSGGINVIDLANIYSCSFIETSDIGRLNNKGQFEVLGRFDDSDIRGCSLLYS